MAKLPYELFGTLKGALSELWTRSGLNVMKSDGFPSQEGINIATREPS